MTDINYQNNPKHQSKQLDAKSWITFIGLVGSNLDCLAALVHWVLGVLVNMGCRGVP